MLWYVMGRDHERDAHHFSSWLLAKKQELNFLPRAAHRIGKKLYLSKYCTYEFLF